MLLIACPCYNNQMYYQCAKSLLELKDLIDFDIQFIGFDSLIPRARNYLAHIFMSNDKYDKLFFLDVDIQFNPKDIVALYNHPDKIICGAYPKKKLERSIITKNVLLNKDPLANASKLAINVSNTKENIQQIDEAPTGFLMIHKDVFEFLKNHVDFYFSDISAYQSQNKIYNFFSPFVHKNRYLSEDYAFSHLCRKHNFKITLLKDIKLKHIGTYIYK